MSKRTWPPLSRNHSAMRVARNAARIRTSAGRVRGGDDNYRAPSPLFAQDPFDELGDLPATFTYEGDYRHVGGGPPRDHRHERGLADARASEYPEALPAPARDEPVEDANAELQLVSHKAATERMRWRPVDPDLLEPEQGRPTVDRTPKAVEDTPEELLADANRERSMDVLDKGTDAQPGRVAVGQARHALAAQRHDLGEDRCHPVVEQQAPVTYGKGDPDDLDGHSDHAHDAARSGAGAQRQRPGPSRPSAALSSLARRLVKDLANPVH